MVIFRDYQLDCINTIHTHFASHNKQLIQLPTGAGKTYILLEYLKRHSKRSLIIVPTLELLEQVQESSENFFHKSQVYAKSHGKYKNANHIIITAASLNYESTRTWLLDFEFDTIVIDEAHRAQANTYIDFLDLYKKNSSCDFKLLGLTATPERLDRKSLLEIFDKLTFEMNVVELIKKGHLCDIEGTRFLTGQKLPTYLSNGDFRAVQLRKLDNEDRNNIIKKVVVDHCQGKQTIIFCLSIDHCETLAKDLQKMGFNADFVHGNLRPHERRRRVQMYRDGRIQIVTNVQLLTEGFDAPCTKAIIIARPTRSKALYCQMIGRGLRNFQDKECCYLYELTDNNHKICTFNVACDLPVDDMREYKPGTRLTKLKELRDSETFLDIETKIEKINVFQTADNFLTNLDAMPFQEEKLNNSNIKIYDQINMKEALFLLWKDKLERKYGFN